MKRTHHSKAGALHEAFAIASWCFLLCLGLAGPARAQVGVSALPTLYRLPWLEAPTRRVRLAASGAYGFTGDVLGAGDAHHRAVGGLGVAVQGRSGLAAEARTELRYDAHVLRGRDDSGGVIDPRFALRYAKEVAEQTRLGAQVSVWVPGSNFPNPAFDATTVDLSALLGAHVASALDLSVLAGYRLDRSARAVKHPERLSAADYSALGLSSFDAALVGAGLRHAYTERGAWFAELNADLLLGSGAPSLGNSPIRAALGADRALGESGTRGRLALQVALNGRTRVDVTRPLSPIEPRILVVLAITQDVLTEPAPKVIEPVVAEPPAPEPEPAPAPAVVETPKEPIGTLRLFVRDTDWGEPVEAEVLVTVPGQTVPSATGLTTKSREGMLEIDVKPGRYEVRIDAKGYAAQRRTIKIEEGGVTVLNVDLRPKEEP